jgi:hypothetical protein
METFATPVPIILAVYIPFQCQQCLNHKKTLALQAPNLVMEVSPLCCILFSYVALVMHDIIHKTLAHFFP